MLTFEKWNLILISDVYSANLKWGSKVTFQNFNLSWKFKSKHFKIMITDFHFCMILKRVSTCYRYYWFVYISHWFLEERGFIREYSHRVNHLNHYLWTEFLSPFLPTIQIRNFDGKDGKTTLNWTFVGSFLWKNSNFAELFHLAGSNGLLSKFYLETLVSSVNRNTSQMLDYHKYFTFQMFMRISIWIFSFQKCLECWKHQSLCSHGG